MNRSEAALLVGLMVAMMSGCQSKDGASARVEGDFRGRDGLEFLFRGVERSTRPNTWQGRTKRMETA